MTFLVLVFESNLLNSEGSVMTSQMLHRLFAFWHFLCVNLKQPNWEHDNDHKGPQLETEAEGESESVSYLLIEPLRVGARDEK